MLFNPEIIKVCVLINFGSKMPCSQVRIYFLFSKDLGRMQNVKGLPPPLACPPLLTPLANPPPLLPWLAPYI